MLLALEKYNDLIEGQLQNTDPALWTKVRLESFKSELPRLEEFLTLGARNRVWVEKNNKARQPQIDWEHWDSDQKESFQRICGDAMSKWYPEWLDNEGNWLQIPMETPDVVPFRIKLSRYLKHRLRKLAKSS